MRIMQDYSCDKCGARLSKGQQFSLSTFYQSGVAYADKNPHGVRHLCSACKIKFDKNFSNYFTHLNEVINKIPSQITRSE